MAIPAKDKLRVGFMESGCGWLPFWLERLDEHWELTPEQAPGIYRKPSEYFLSGRANAYDWLSTGAVVRTPNAPYTTRVLVRRPKTKAKFSGRVVVEMMNPSNLLDLNIGWAIHREQLMREGDAWVAVTAKPIAVATLKASRTCMPVE